MGASSAGSVLIGFIGVGQMGTAMLRGLAGRDDVELCGYDVNAARLTDLARGLNFTPMGSAAEVAAQADYVVLAVKPQHLAALMDDVHLRPEQCLVSIAAGITQARLADLVGGVCPVARVMPNTPALVGAGVFALCLDDQRLSAAQRAFLPDMLASLGRVYVLPEGQFDAFTAVVGSGPAYVVYFMEGLVEAAVTLGLPRQEATEMVLGLFDGTSRLAVESDKRLAELRDMVTSPGGTTARGLNHLDRQAVRAAIIDAAVAAYHRSRELGA